MNNVISVLLNVTNRLLYIDPAATSILLASLTSIAVVAGAVFIILWRKLKKGVKKTLHIDENAGKEVEDELVVTDEELKEEGAESDTKEGAESSESAEATVKANDEKAEAAPAVSEEEKKPVGDVAEKSEKEDETVK